MEFSAEILAERKQGVGSSESPALFGLGYAHQTPLSLYLAKRGEIDQTVADSEMLLWGNLLEAPIADEWSRRTQIKIRKQPMMKWMQNRAETPLFASIDRQIIGHPRGPGCLEIKNYSEWTGRAIDTLDDVPPRVLVQIQHQLAVTGYTWGVLAMLVGGNRLLTFEIDRDDEAIAQIIETCRTFMHRVREGKPPAVDAHSDVVLGKAYAQGGGGTITSVDPALDRIAREAVEWRQRAKDAEEALDLRKNCLKLVMANAEELVIPGFGSFAWKKSKNKLVREFDEEAFKAAEPETYEKFVKKVEKVGHRTFTMKPDKD